MKQSRQLKCNKIAPRANNKCSLVDYVYRSRVCVSEAIIISGQYIAMGICQV